MLLLKTSTELVSLEMVVLLMPVSSPLCYTSEWFYLTQWIACWPWDSKALLLNSAISRTMVTGTEFTYSVS